jgi:hypothetical protein
VKEHLNEELRFLLRLSKYSNRRQPSPFSPISEVKSYKWDDEQFDLVGWESIDTYLTPPTAKSSPYLSWASYTPTLTARNTKNSYGELPSRLRGVKELSLFALVAYDTPIYYDGGSPIFLCQPGHVFLMDRSDCATEQVVDRLRKVGQRGTIPTKLCSPYLYELDARYLDMSRQMHDMPLPPQLRGGDRAITNVEGYLNLIRQGALSPEAALGPYFHLTQDGTVMELRAPLASRSSTYVLKFSCL